MLLVNKVIKVKIPNNGISFALFIPYKKMRKFINLIGCVIIINQLKGIYLRIQPNNYKNKL